jgi:pyruvate formate lyase activating enzyme
MRLFNAQHREKMADINGTIFNIKRFSVHDGPGIRTSIFLKGCPLHCIWCHNPEGINHGITIWYNRNTCIACGQCVEVCPKQALSLNLSEKKLIEIDYNKCDITGNCVKICPTGSLQFTGSRTTVSDIMIEIMKDSLYYLTSGGGVTLSGGEPTLQPDFCLEILKKCKTAEIHTAIETCLFCERKVLDSLIDYVDLFIVDMKIFDSSTHEKYTGKPNEIIKENLGYLVVCNKEILVRVPLIENITDNSKNKKVIEQFVYGFSRNIQIEYLNFNPLTKSKYQKLSIPFSLDKI